MSKRRLLILLPLLSLFAGCDPYHKDKCEWYLVPEPEHINLVEEGWVPICARNYTINKERCYLKSSLEFAKELNGKLIRLSSLKVSETGPFPREILSVKTCKAEKE